MSRPGTLAVSAVGDDVDVIALRRVALWLLLASKLTAGWGLGWDIRWHLLVGRDSFWIAPHIMTYSGVTLMVLASLGVLAWTSWQALGGVREPGLRHARVGQRQAGERVVRQVRDQLALHQG